MRMCGRLAISLEAARAARSTWAPGQGCSVRQVIATVERIAGCPVPFRETARREGDPPELVADPALARTRLDWQPRHSDLDTIIRTALAWERRAGHAQP